MVEFLFKELTRTVIGVYFDVYNGLGHTYPEFVYESAMRRQLEEQGILCQRQEECRIFYNVALVFPVTISNPNDISFNNLKNWLRVEQIPLGIVANFHDVAFKPLILKASSPCR